jgi:type I restriction enzyme R subunit/putative DNA methylase
MRFDAERYRLLAFVVMPNHCHVLIECIDACPLWKIVNSWKSYTARWINKYVVGREGLGTEESTGRAGARRSRGRSQRLWQRDYWDRYIRNERHLRSAKAYIENNPVAAGLAKNPGDWPWSSAAYGSREVTA